MFNFAETCTLNYYISALLNSVQNSRDALMNKSLHIRSAMLNFRIRTLIFKLISYRVAISEFCKNGVILVQNSFNKNIFQYICNMLIFSSTKKVKK